MTVAVFAYQQNYDDNKYSLLINWRALFFHQCQYYLLHEQINRVILKWKTDVFRVCAPRQYLFSFPSHENRYALAWKRNLFGLKQMECVFKMKVINTALHYTFRCCEVCAWSTSELTLSSSLNTSFSSGWLWTIRKNIYQLVLWQTTVSVIQYHMKDAQCKIIVVPKTRPPTGPIEFNTNQTDRKHPPRMKVMGNGSKWK